MPRAKTRRGEIVGAGFQPVPNPIRNLDPRSLKHGFNHFRGLKYTGPQKRKLTPSWEKWTRSSVESQYATQKGQKH